MTPFYLPSGPSRCTLCSASIEHVGICLPCAEALEKRERECGREAALRFIPKAFRWSCFQDHRLFRIINGRTINEAIGVVPAILTGTTRGCVVTGQVGAGKTLLASAMLAEVVQTSPKTRAHWQCAVELSVARRDSGYGRTPEAVR
jgi:hypothetical protein